MEEIKVNFSEYIKEDQLKINLDHMGGKKFKIEKNSIRYHSYRIKIKRLITRSIKVKILINGNF